MPAEVVNVTVTPKIRQNNNVYCEIEPGHATGANRVRGGVIKLPGRGPYTVNFELQPGDVQNLAWSTDAAGNCNAFWSDGNGCPPGNRQDAQVTANPAANGNVVTLQITPNAAKAPNVLHYALNFDDPAGAQLQFDPIIIVG